MIESDRWRLALRAHAAEHAAMHERGLGRIGISGRPRLPMVPFGPRGLAPRTRGISGMDLSPGAKTAIWGLGGLALGAGLVYAASRAGVV